MNDAPAPPWLHRAGQHLRARWLTKLLGITAGMTLFFVAYFWLLRHPARPPVVMPLTALDGWIGFHPGALPLYLSLWIYVSLTPGLIVGRRELAAYALAAVALGLAGLGVFWLWPTAVPAFDAPWAADSSFAFLKNIDASGNACPSLHVAFAVFTAVELAHLLRGLGAGLPVRLLNWLWCAGILYSTVATRQHVVFDVAAGTALGAIFAAAHGRWGNRAAG